MLAWKEFCWVQSLHIDCFNCYSYLSRAHLNFTQEVVGTRLHLYISWPRDIGICDFLRYEFGYLNTQYLYNNSIGSVTIPVEFATRMRIDVNDNVTKASAFKFDFETKEGSKYLLLYPILFDRGPSKRYAQHLEEYPSQSDLLFLKYVQLSVDDLEAWLLKFQKANDFICYCF